MKNPVGDKRDWETAEADFNAYRELQEEISQSWDREQFSDLFHYEREQGITDRYYRLKARRDSGPQPRVARGGSVEDTWFEEEKVEMDPKVLNRWAGDYPDPHLVTFRLVRTKK